jgi:transcriptional regulator with XRE-family HTH domain
MNQLGTALRAWRDRLDPAEAGLAHHSPRRVTGLRRAELAALAGISVEYVIRLEQGRAPTPSAQVCSALARALRLTGDEHAHLLRLAGHSAGQDRVPQLIPANLHLIMDQLAADPVAVYDAAWNLLHWNPLFAAVAGDPSTDPPGRRNALLRWFEEGPGQTRMTAHESAGFEESLVADLRAATGRYPRDPDLAALVTRLRRNERFRELWERPTVAQHETASKIFEHPDVGDIAVDAGVLTLQPSGLHLVVHTPRPGTDARGKLDLLAAIGLQRLLS